VQCPKCGADSKVYDSKPGREPFTRIRVRDCPNGHMFKTVEGLLPAEDVPPRATQTPRDVTDRIIRLIADEAGIEVGAILGRQRSPKVIEARVRAIRTIAAEFPGWSFARIAKIFSMDYSTVGYWLKDDAFRTAKRAATRERNLER